MNINNVSGVRPEINEIMSKIREISNKSNVFKPNEAPKESGNFESLLSVAKNAVSQVNEMQVSSDAVKTAYIAGDGNVSMSQVIVASQKSKLAFEGLLVVRNKILEAYKEIMNMQV